MTESERIDYLIKVLAGGNAAEFAERIGTTRSIVSRIRSPKYPNRITRYIDGIIRAYPAVNREWLETGEGYPGDLTIDLVKAHYESRIRRADMVIDYLTRRVNELENALKDV